MCVALGDGSIVTYATTLAHCNAAVTCMNDWPTYYTEDYGTVRHDTPLNVLYIYKHTYLFVHIHLEIYQEH